MADDSGQAAAVYAAECGRLRAENAELLALLAAPLPEEVAEVVKWLHDPRKFEVVDMQQLSLDAARLLERLARSAQDKQNAIDNVEAFLLRVVQERRSEAALLPGLRHVLTMARRMQHFISANEVEDEISRIERELTDQPAGQEKAGCATAGAVRRDNRQETAGRASAQSSGVQSAPPVPADPLAATQGGQTASSSDHESGPASAASLTREQINYFIDAVPYDDEEYQQIRALALRGLDGSDKRLYELMNLVRLDGYRYTDDEILARWREGSKA